MQCLTNDTDLILTDYRDCLNLTMCPDATNSCHFGKCSNCPGVKKIRNNLIQALKEENLEEVKFDSWVETDRCNLKTLCMDLDDFAKEFCKELLKLRTHDFLTKEQALFFKNLKTNLENDEFLITFDFAENYKFVLQNSAQGFHWNND